MSESNQRGPRSVLREHLQRTSAIYSDNNLRDTGGLLAKLANVYSHAFLESSFPGKLPGGKVLELGASDDRHLRHVANYGNYLLADADIGILSRVFPYDRNGDVQIRKLDATRLKQELCGEKFDRIIACNVLEHLPNPENCLIDWYEALEVGGWISLLQPCDPGLLWRLGRNLGPRRGLVKKGINYDLLMALEHINSIGNITTICENLFDNINTSYFPFGLKSWNFNLFLAIHIEKL